jgi:hypothetical protein
MKKRGAVETDPRRVVCMPCTRPVPAVQRAGTEPGPAAVAGPKAVRTSERQLRVRLLRKNHTAEIFLNAL